MSSSSRPTRARSSKGKNVASSSTAPPPSSAPSLPATFKNAEARRRYNYFFRQATIVPERKIFLDQLRNYDIAEFFDARGWIDMVTNPSPISEQLVREFYSHLVLVEGSSDTLSTYVRGISFEVTADIIAEILEIPRESDELFPFDLENLNFTFDQVAFLLCGRHKSLDGKSPLPQGNLLINFRILHLFVCSYLYPVKRSFEVTSERGLAMYALALAYPIDYAGIVFDGFVRKAESMEGSLGFPALITRLCLKHGIPLFDSDKLIVGKKIDFGSIRRSRSHANDDDDDDDDEVPSPPPPPMHVPSAGFNEPLPSGFFNPIPPPHPDCPPYFKHYYGAFSSFASDMHNAMDFQVEASRRQEAQLGKHGELLDSLRSDVDTLMTKFGDGHASDSFSDEF